MIRNQPLAALRVVSMRLLDLAGDGLSLATSWSVGQVKVIKGDGSIADATNLPEPVTGASAGTFTLQLEIAEVDTFGMLRIQITPASGQYAEYVDEVTSSSTDAEAIATAVGDLVMDTDAPTGAQTLRENINILTAFAASEGTGYPASVIQTITHKSLDGERTRLKTTISGGRRVVDEIDGT